MRGVLIGIRPILAAAALAFGLSTAQAAETAHQGGIEEIAINLEFSGEYIGQEAQERLEFALLDTLQLALIGQLEGDLAYIHEHQQNVTSTIGEVISEALSKRGLVLEELVLDAGPLTTVTIKLHLAEQQVSEFAVQFHILGNSPIVQSAVAEDVAAVQSTLNAQLASTPYSDTRWISAMVSEIVDSHFAELEAYQGFDRLVTVQPGELTAVAVTFTPRARESVLDCYALKFHSLSLPLIMLEDTRHAADAYLGSLVGAPISFITAKLNLIRESLYRHLISECELAQAATDLAISAELRDCCLRMEVNAESEKIMALGQARLDLWDRGQRDYAGRLRGRLGYQVQPGWPLYGHVDYYPAGGEAFPLLGVGHLFDGDFFAGAGWDLHAEALRFQGLGYLEPDIYLEADVFAGDEWDDLSEISLHYRLKEIYELQLISSFGGEVFAAVAANL